MELYLRYKSGLLGLALERVQAGNQLLLFMVQLCAVLYEAVCYFSVENPELCWTWSLVVVVAGLAHVIATRLRSCIICLVCINWQNTQSKGLENKFA